jgi:hypothetical protein
MGVLSVCANGIDAGMGFAATEPPINNPNPKIASIITTRKKRLANIVLTAFARLVIHIALSLLRNG